MLRFLVFINPVTIIISPIFWCLINRCVVLIWFLFSLNFTQSHKNPINKKTGKWLNIAVCSMLLKIAETVAFYS